MPLFKMDLLSEEEQSGFNNGQLYADTCHQFSLLVQKIDNMFPALEALQPEKSGMQALCELHWALDKAKSFLHQILNSSRLYLAITSDSVVVKFEKAKEYLERSLKNLLLNVPEAFSEELNMLVIKLEKMTCQLDPSDQDAGKKMILLLQKERDTPSYEGIEELELFDEVAHQLRITSSKAVFSERKALKRLLVKVRNEEDKKKELIVLYLLHMLRKYVKLKKITSLEGSGSFRDVYNLNSPPPSDRGSEASTSGRDSDLSSELSFSGTRGRGSACYVYSPLPPEEFLCPISLQLMADPVIISSGQTYERVCIEKWFEEGRDTCPKTQQKLEHLCMTPNYCVKALIISWCEKNSVPIPSPPSPPPSPISNWRFDLHSANDQKMSNVPVLSITPKSNFRPMVDGCTWPAEATEEQRVSENCKEMQHLVEQLQSSNQATQCKAAEDIRYLTKENAGSRVYLAQLGCIPALVGLLSSAISTGDETAQISACLALSNIAVNNNRNTSELVRAGSVPLLVKVLKSNVSSTVKDSAIVVLLTVSCVEENRLRGCLSEAVPFLVKYLGSDSAQGVRDALSTLFNFSAFPGNQLVIVNSNALTRLVDILGLEDLENRAKCVAILYSISSIEEGRSSIMQNEGCISHLVDILDNGTEKEKEQIAATFLIICTHSSHHSQLILQEGIIPSLVMLSVNGTQKGRDKAKKLLQHFRQQRQKEVSWHSAPQVSSCPSAPLNIGNATQCSSIKVPEKKTRSTSSFAFFRRSTSLSFYRLHYRC